MKKRIGASLIATAFLGTAAQAQLSFGGNLDNLYFYSTGLGSSAWENTTVLRGSVAYENGDFTLGAGASVTFYQLSILPDPITNWNMPYVYVGYKNLTLAYGGIEGAGNLFPQHYFGYHSLTFLNDNTLRVDYAAGDFHIAASVDLAFTGFYELGLDAKLGQIDIRAAYDSREEKLGALVGRGFGRLNVQISGIYDFDDGPSRTYGGLTLFYDIGDRLSVGANLNYDLNGEARYGVRAAYDTGMAQIQATYTKDGLYDEFMLGISVPFGNTPPAAQGLFGASPYGLHG